MLLLFDKGLESIINGYIRSPFLDMVMPLFSDAWLLWMGLFLFLAGYGVWCRRRYGEMLPRVLVLVVFLGLSAGMADGMCNVIKDRTGRHRPFQTEAGTRFFTPDRQWTVIENPSYAPGSTGGSFPSSHAATSMAVALGTALLFARSRPWIFALPFLVGWSRVYVGKHFPLDVVAGWLVGALAVVAVWWICHVLFRVVGRRERRLSPKMF